MPYELYRRSTLGECLTDALDELIQAAQVTPQLAMRVLLQFDKSMNEALAEQVQSRAVIKGALHSYRYCDEVWTFVVENASIRMQDIQAEPITADRVKIIACNAGRKPESGA